jgi:hypothetical protein
MNIARTNLGDAAAASTIDAANPWLGLASFTEETRQYFYGREEEVAELARRVQRKLLTILFGQSGLGKTSILRAGLVPRLRAQGYCPVYVRIDYGREAPEPSEQIKRAILQTASRSGQWTQAGVAEQGESLWEFLHHRDDVLRDAAGATLVPLLIFDQFEEIFTLAQSDDFGRARAARFVEDLADLVENRPPKALEAKLEADESAAERFDFARSDYRVLISLREDYLAPLEGLKAAMPSITQNRLRLAPMTGKQALAAVMQPGKGLVTEEVAAAIVRFVAGGAELANAEVEPSLLSLICRELNDTRLVEGRSEISLDLLAGSHASILSNFYERSLADQPPAVRRVIEDELLTDSGFRENVAEERLLASFKAAGAAPNALAVLVNRRLLRIEERLDVRRVELTHDVLCGVVKASRDLRREREARDATERLLAEQRGRELAARRALVRARQVATVCIVLAVGAAAAAVFGYLSAKRARHAELAAHQIGAAADQARRQAEQLLGYLTDDFARELETFGRLDIVAELAKRQVDYFNALPPTLRGPESVRNGARAMVYYAGAMRRLGKSQAAMPAANEATRLLEQLRAQGDTSEATTIVLALAGAVQAKIFSNQQDPRALPTALRAAELLKPVAEAPQASVAARRAYVEVLTGLGYEQQAQIGNEKDAVATLQLAKDTAAQLGARDLANMEMAARYAEAGTWQAQALIALGRNAEARQVGSDASAIAAKVLEARPNYLQALRAQEIALGALGTLALMEMRPADAVNAQERDLQDALTLVQLDSTNTISINNLGSGRQGLGDAYWAAGRVAESLQSYRQGLEDLGRVTDGEVFFKINTIWGNAQLAAREADNSDLTHAEANLANATHIAVELKRSEAAGSSIPAMSQCLVEYGRAAVAMWRGDAASARQITQDVVGVMKSLEPKGGLETFYQNICTFGAFNVHGQAAYLLGDYAGAERAARDALEARARWPVQNDQERRDQAEASIGLALALVRQGHAAQALQIIDPVVGLHRELAARNHGDQWQHVELASALYVQALCDPARRAALLHEAAALVDSVPAAMRALHSVRRWHDRIALGLRGGSAAMVAPDRARSAG